MLSVSKMGHGMCPSPVKNELLIMRNPLFMQFAE